ncbi:predicted protein [Pyrenophora tritici-repentis Pt-1C-BFP]|uniref:Uncharacterized protein n=1 Tax=Pyrenophora tritici-repentis (strain Pt-1C-BFP) TaxID=426418 RepID=B2WDC8_PYRTR|nr:uncharacterized protein PTRG_07987 [Pyrenophora tritici-repentis Pt-1C-BFP]EDU50906.1 predicted protein [Pyrenophora tritici-repentis Pt-1C-BFP]
MAGSTAVASAFAVEPKQTGIDPKSLKVCCIISGRCAKVGLLLLPSLQFLVP